MDGTNSNRRAQAQWRELIRHGLSRLAHSKAGLTAIEVALVMPVFILLTFGIVETAMLFFIATTLEAQTGAAGRQIRTGNVQASGNPINAFKDIMCNGLGGVIDCDRVIFDVRSYSSFGGVSYPSFLNPDGTANNPQFTPGAPGDIVIVRVVYQWDILTPFLGQFFGDNGGQTKQLSSAAAFRNEPYQAMGG
jgi:Flp pilus assembly protein TadG